MKFKFVWSFLLLGLSSCAQFEKWVEEANRREEEAKAGERKGADKAVTNQDPQPLAKSPKIDKVVDSRKATSKGKIVAVANSSAEDEDEDLASYIKNTKMTKDARDEAKEIAKIPRMSIEYNTKLYPNTKLYMNNKKLNLKNKDVRNIAQLYTRLLKKSKYCCSYGLINDFKKTNISPEVSKIFMYQDKKGIDSQNYCLFTPTSEIMKSMPYSLEMNRMYQNIKYSCLCMNNQHAFKQEIEEYKKVVAKNPEFKYADITIEYDDDVNARNKRSLKDDMLSIEAEMKACEL